MLPVWLEPLPDAEAMRAADRAAIEAGTPGLELMERAAAGLARAVDELVGEGLVVLVCGGGNNGGDGWAAARLLADRGRDVRVAALAPVPELSGDARANAERVPTELVVGWDAGALDGAAVVVDCVLGTGFSGAPRGVAAEAIEAMSRAGVPVVACDVPSGVDASSGEVDGPAVRAQLTVTFAAAKPGLHVHPGKAHAGRVQVVPIGVEAEARCGLIRPDAVDVLRRRDASATKFSSGHVVVAGGSTGMTGAVRLAAAAAMRAGAGYATACVPPALVEVVDLALVEVVTRPLDAVDTALEKADALVLGCGLGRDEDAVAFARDLAARAAVPLLLDADGLNAHAGRIESLRDRDAPTVLTPHAGELARLLETDSATIGRHRLGSAREAAARSGAIVVLKGDDTIVAEPDGRVAVSPGGAPALATAGTGDVLAGAAGAALATGADPFHAVCAAVLAHVRAGRLAAAPHGPDGVVAGDVLACLPAAIGG